MDKILSQIKERLLCFLEFKAVTRESFCRITGISPSNFKGVGLRSELGGDKIIRILECYPDLNTNWLLTGRGQMTGGTTACYSAMPESTAAEVSDVSTSYVAASTDDFSVPLYRLDASVGLDAIFRGAKEPESRVVLPGLPLCDGALYVQGDSMTPFFRSGDIVVYKKMRDLSCRIIWGETYLLSFNVDGEAYISICRIQPGSDIDHVKLESSNPQYPPQEILRTAIQALALVKASVRYNTMG